VLSDVLRLGAQRSMHDLTAWRGERSICMSRVPYTEPNTVVYSGLQSSIAWLVVESRIRSVSCTAP
jgi:hypothetical protein